jgi:hypothetical protein
LTVFVVPEVNGIRFRERAYQANRFVSHRRSKLYSRRNLSHAKRGC